jgi:hypothetical protein
MPPNDPYSSMKIGPENGSKKEANFEASKTARTFGRFSAPEMRDDPRRFLGGKKLT